MGSKRERAARPEFGPGSNGRFKISGNSPGAPSSALTQRPELGDSPGGPSPHTTCSFFPILSMHSRTKSSCSSVWVAM